MMSKMSKKGVTNELLHVFTEIAMIALVIGIFFFMAVKLWGSIFGSNDDKDTLRSFESLADNVQLMIDKPDDFEHQSMTIYLEEDYYIFGFINSGDTSSTSSAYYQNSGDYPDDCGDGPCLCLYKDLSSFPSKPVKCKAFPSNIIFHGYIETEETLNHGVITIHEHVGPIGSKSVTIPLTPYSSDYPEELRLDYQYLVIGVSNDKSFWNLYIEKFVSNNRKHMLITSQFDNDQIEQRTSLLLHCPEGSDTQCIGQPINQNIGSDFCYFDESQKICVFKSDVAECDVGPKLLKTCLCGSELVEITSWSDFYCYQRPKEEKSLIVLKFDCNDIKECADYCTAITDTAGCAFEEVDYCNQHPCNKRCVAKQDGAKYNCVSV